MRAALLSALIFLAAFGLNLATLSPAVHPDDSPETVTAAATLSIQHPPGYPLHSLLGRLAFLSLPGGAAFRVNLLSAFFGALGLLLFAYCLRLVAMELGASASLALALAPTAVLALSYSLWFQSSIAKGGIYTLNFFLTQATLLALLSARSGNAWRGLRLAALCFGLAMANHWTSQVVLLPGYAVLMIGLFFENGGLASAIGRRGRPRSAPTAPTIPIPPSSSKAKFVFEIGMLLLLTASGMSLYLFLPLRSLLHPVMSWGEPWTLKGFLWVFNRAQYAGIESSKSLAAFLALLRRVFEDLKFEFHAAGLIVIAAGWILLLRIKPWLGAGLLAMPLTLALAVCVKANPPPDSLWVIDPYLLPLYSGLALGLAGFLALEPRSVAAVLALGALGLGLWHKPMADQSQNFLGYDYAANLFLSAPKNSLLFCEGDSNTALPLYYRYVLGKRQDLAPVATVLSDYPWYIQNAARLNPGLKVPPSPLGPPGNIAWMSKANAPRPVILSNSMTKDWVDLKRLEPRGLAYRYRPLGAPGPAASELLAANPWPAYALRGVFAPAQPMDPLTVRLVRDNYKESPVRLAEALQAAGDWRAAARQYAFLGTLMPGWAAPWVQAGNTAFFGKDIEQAGSYWKRAVAEEPSSGEAYANLALYQFSKKDYDLAQQNAVKALERNPNIANARDLLEKSRAMINGVAQPATQNQGQAWAAQGDALAQKGQASEALEAYGQAMRAGFVSAGVHRNRAVMLARLGKNAEAATALRAALKLEPGNAELHKYLGIMLFNAAQSQAALMELETSARLNPSDSQLPALIAQVKAKAKP